jgi:hypothetical protein
MCYNTSHIIVMEEKKNLTGTQSTGMHVEFCFSSLVVTLLK